MTPSISRRTLLTTGLATGTLGGLALAGCSNEGRGAQGPTDQGAQNAVLPSYIPYEGIDPDIPASDGVANTFFAYPSDPVQGISETPGDGDPITTMGLTNTPIPPGLDQNTFWQELNERIGSPLDISLYNPSDYEDRFPTAVAGDQLTDIFCVGSAPQLPALLEEKALDLTEHLAGDAIADYPFLANIPTDSWKSCVYNGKIFAIPVPRGVISSYVLYGRGDLLEEQGITESPASYEDFVDICTELTAPSSNTWALSYLPIDYIRQMYGVPNAWQLGEDGSLTSAYEHEGQKEALEAGRQMVESGVVNPDAFSAQWQEYKTWFANGTTFYTYDSFSAWPGFYQLRASGDFSLAAFTVPMADGSGPGASWIGSATNSVTAFNKNAGDRVETLLKVMNWMAAPFGTQEYIFRKYGVEGEDHTLEGTDPILTDKGKSEVQLGLLYLTDSPWPIYLPGMPDEAQAQHDAQMAVVPDGVKNPVMGLYSETDAQKGGQINQDIGSITNDILQGREPVSAWDDVVEKWKSDGGDEIRDEFQAALEEAESAA